MFSGGHLGGVVSDEFVADAFATGNGPFPLTAPMISSLFPAGAKPASTGEGLLWGCLGDPMSSREKVTKMAFSIEEAPCTRPP